MMHDKVTVKNLETLIFCSLSNARQVLKRLSGARDNIFNSHNCTYLQHFAMADDEQETYKLWRIRKTVMQV